MNRHTVRTYSYTNFWNAIILVLLAIVKMNNGVELHSIVSASLSYMHFDLHFIVLLQKLDN